MSVSDVNIINVTSENVSDIGIYCIKNKKAPGFKSKVNWFKAKINEGLKIKIAADENEKQLGFIEFIPSEKAWRPVKAQNYYFIHCIALFGKDVRNQNIGSMLVSECEKDAKTENKDGICVMTSDGAWIANKSLFEKNGFEKVDTLGRFELLCKKLKNTSNPEFYDWKKHQADYRGWHLIYSDQCPWHEKSIDAIATTAEEHSIDLNIKKLTSPEEAQRSPSGYGTFTLIKDGTVLEDHYISKRRFENILKEVI